MTRAIIDTGRIPRLKDTNKPFADALRRYTQLCAEKRFEEAEQAWREAQAAARTQCEPTPARTAGGPRIGGAA